MTSSFATKLVALSSAAALIIGITACTQVADTDRKQFNAFKSPEQQAGLARTGFAQFEQMKRSKKISNNPGYNEQVQRVGRRLAQVMPVPNAQWEFVVFEDSSPNAFALPGGKVGVHTGLFQITQDDAGLAAVLGHEVAHVVANHAGERMTRATATAVGTAVLTNILTDSEDSTRKKLATGAALGAVGTGSVLAHSRKQELEADELGALYMARAGYDPRAAVALWQRFAAYKQQQGGNKTPVFLSTHPLDENRIISLQQYMPRAMSEYRG